MLSVILGLVTVGALAYCVYRMIAVRAEMRRADARSPTVVKAETVAPDFAGIEALFGAPVPAELRWLYEQPQIVRQRSLTKPSTVEPSELYYIDRFLPPVPDTVRSAWFDIGANLFPFAIDIAGNYLAVPVERGRAAEVIYIDHEQSTSWTVASSLREFINEGNRATPDQ
jgi:hypothetical protein